MKAYKAQNFFLIIYFMNIIAELKNKHDNTQLIQNHEFDIQILLLKVSHSFKHVLYVSQIPAIYIHIIYVNKNNQSCCTLRC